MYLAGSTEVSLFFNAIPEHCDAFFPGWQEFKNSVPVWNWLLHSQPCTNSNFYFLVSVQSATLNCRLRCPAKDGPSGQGQERSVGVRLHASAAKWIKIALFWAITQRVVVISYRHFGTIYRSHPQGSCTLKVGLIDCPETSVGNCHHSLHNSPEERSSHVGSMVVKIKTPLTQKFQAMETYLLNTLRSILSDENHHQLHLTCANIQQLHCTCANIQQLHCTCTNIQQLHCTCANI